jgi:hypothetical protein
MIFRCRADSRFPFSRPRARPHEVFINEVGNDIAQKSVDVAVNYIKKMPSLGLSVEVMAVEGNRTDSKGLLEAICSRYAESLQANQPPHVIFDTTKTGVSSETVKSVASALGIPTVSASFGQEGDLRQWRDISDKKKNYLLQVMPPSDMLTEIVRAIVIYNNITNAAILYDETFVVDHKYKALLQNIPTRHVITAIAGDRERSEQLTKLRNLDINNYFILGTLESIKKVLGESCPPLRPSIVFVYLPSSRVLSFVIVLNTLSPFFLSGMCVSTFPFDQFVNTTPPTCAPTICDFLNCWSRRLSLNIDLLSLVNLSPSVVACRSGEEGILRAEFRVACDFRVERGFNCQHQQRHRDVRSTDARWKEPRSLGDNENHVQLEGKTVIPNTID